MLVYLKWLVSASTQSLIVTGFSSSTFGIEVGDMIEVPIWSGVGGNWVGRAVNFGVVVVCVVGLISPWLASFSSSQFSSFIDLE